MLVESKRVKYTSQNGGDTQVLRFPSKRELFEKFEQSKSSPTFYIEITFC